MVAILREVGIIERDALKADGDELRMVEEKLDGLMRRLIEEGIITAERWTEFFGKADL
jgi:hypothetical protein